ncbi:sulfotransferase 1B1-like [Styela clava]
MFSVLIATVVLLVSIVVYVGYKMKTMKSIDRIALETKIWLPINKFYCMIGVMERMRPKENHIITGNNGVTIPMPFPDWGVVTKEFYKFEIRENDIIVSTYPKAGTTWMQEITWLICHNADTITSKKSRIDLRVPFYEYVDPYNYPTGSKCLEDWPTDKQRIIKTHVPFDLLPKEFQQKRKGKMIYVARNAKDVCVSFHHFLSINPTVTPPGTWAEFFQKYCTGDVPYGSWFSHVLQYWKKYEEQGNEKYIYFTTYETLKQDLRGEVAKISKFLGKDLTDQQMDIIANHCTMDNMRNNKSTSNLHLIDPKQGKFMRKGQVGDWKNHFTLNQNEAFDEMYEERMKGSDLHIPFEI